MLIRKTEQYFPWLGHWKKIIILSRPLCFGTLFSKEMGGGVEISPFFYKEIEKKNWIFFFFF